MDTIFIKNLIVLGAHGVSDAEKAALQRYQLSISIRFDPHRAADTDSLDDTYDYAPLKDYCLQLFTGRSYNLLEKLAGKIARRILTDRRVCSTTIQIEKIDIWG